MAIDIAARATGAGDRVALQHRQDRPEPRAGEPGEVLTPGPRVGERRLAGVADRRTGIGDLERDPVHAQRVADLRHQGGQHLARDADVGDHDPESVPGLVAARSPAVVVRRPDAELGGLDPPRLGEASGHGAEGAHGVVDTGQRLCDVGGPVPGGEPDDGRVGDDLRAPLAGDGDGAVHADDPSRRGVRPPCADPGRSRAWPWSG